MENEHKSNGMAMLEACKMFNEGKLSIEQLQLVYTASTGCYMSPKVIEQLMIYQDVVNNTPFRKDFNQRLNDKIKQHNDKGGN